jgi:hypothetical protein
VTSRAEGRALGAPIVTVILLATALSAIAFTSVHVSIGQPGLRATAPLGWPRVTIGLDRIAAAEAIEIDPMPPVPRPEPVPRALVADPTSRSSRRRTPPDPVESSVRTH